MTSLSPAELVLRGLGIADPYAAPVPEGVP